MAADTTQGVFPSVQDEALFCIKLDSTAAEFGTDLITAVFCLSRVQIRIINAVPQVDIFNYEFRYGMTIFGRNVLYLIVNHDGNFALAVLPSLHGDNGIFALDNGSDFDARGSVLAQFEMLFRDQD